MELVTLPSDTLDGIIGDAVTSDLKDILYNTYNGDTELLKKAIWNPDVDDYAKSSMTDVMGQLYLDGILPKEEWQGFIKEIVYSDDILGDFFYANLASVICQCHMVEMLQEVRHLYSRGLIDEMAIGPYEDCVDRMFQYLDYEKCFCRKPIHAESLKNWAMFESEESAGRKPDKKAYEKFVREMQRGMNKVEKKVKIGRNDPCPCGSGKKYKQCCLNKPVPELKAKQDETFIESEEERRKWMERYPQLGGHRQEGRVYLEDYYDAESIRIDQSVYLGMIERLHPIWESVDEEAEGRKRRLYLLEAFRLFREKCERESIGTFEEYDRKYAIHYQCREWTEMLLQLLKENADSDKYREVEELCKRMDADMK